MKTSPVWLLFCTSWLGCHAFKPGPLPRSSMSLSAVADLPRTRPFEEWREDTKNEIRSPALDQLTKNARTLYQILGATGQESREELKQLYLKLAKRHHPDAQGAHKDDSFTEIAAAWRVLADPKQRKRYDRSLQAEQISREIEAWASEFSKTAAPVATKALEQVAFPFLRRTTATTLASIHAAAKDWNKKGQNEATGEQDLSRTLAAALKAARRAGRFVDSMELLEKSEDLEARAHAQSIEAKQLLENIRIQSMVAADLALHTPESGMTSAEAMTVLQDFNDTLHDNVSILHFLPRVMLKHTIDEDILELQKAETTFVEAEAIDSQTQAEYDLSAKKQSKVKRDLKRAMAQEEAARLAYEAAQLRVVHTKITLDAISHEAAQAEAEAKRTSAEMERVSAQLARQSERVRRHLKQKAREVFKQRGIPESSDFDEDTLSEEHRAQRLEELNKIRQEEQALSKARGLLEMKAQRLLERASELKARAEAMGQ